MSTVERPYFSDGRRLAAADLRLEQAYETGMRRRLNQGLFTPGVVRGLEVVRTDATHVRVAPGLALDPAGREIVLPDWPDAQRTLAVPAQPPVSGIGGYFLAIRYAEQRVAADGQACTPGDATGRVRELAELLWTETYPAGDRCDPLRTSVDCAVVLAFAHLTNACEIASLEIGVRQYAHPTHVSQTSAYAMEGEKDIDQDNPKVLHFHIRGGEPNTVTLYLRAHPFSSTYYTELGEHTHAVSGTISDEQVDMPHTHDLSVAATTGASPPTHEHGTHEHGRHDHSLWTGSSNSNLPLAQAQILTSVVPGTPVVWTNGEFVPNTWFKRRGNPRGKNDPEGQLTAEDEAWVVKESVEPSGVQPDGVHTHGLSGRAGPSDPAKSLPHHHTFTGSNAVTGATDGALGLPHQARPGPRLDHFAELQVDLDGTDITPQIAERLPGIFGRKLGNGQDVHAIVKEGAGPLDLLEIANAAGLTLDVKPHTLTFHLARLPGGAANGGNLHYNLYVE